MKTAARKENGYTYADYVSWDGDTRYELIDGVAYAMAGASTAHQVISGEIYGQLWQSLRGKSCMVFHPPFDVCLNAAGDNDNTVVEPDIVVVCDRSKLDKKRCNGAPDMVVEILSPSSSSRDKVLKFNKYLQAGVREYWIVDPDSRTVSVYVLGEDGEYNAGAYGETDTAPVHVLDGCSIDLSAVFSEL